MIELILLNLMLGYGVAIVDHQLTFHNVSVWSGFGAITGVREKTALAPMRYRVLPAWLVMRLPTGHRLYFYQLFKLAGFLAAGPTLLLWANALGFSLTEMLITSLLFYSITAGTLRFDYPDFAWEVACIAVTYWSLTVSLPFVGLLVLPFWLLLRESAVFSVVIYAAHVSPWAVGALVLYLAGRWLLRRVQGDAKHYIPLMFGSMIPWKRNQQLCRDNFGEDVVVAGNYDEVRNVLKGLVYAHPMFMTFFLLAAMAYVAGTGIVKGVVTYQLLIPAAVMSGAALLLGKWGETRVFLSPAVVMLIYGVLSYG